MHMKILISTHTHIHVNLKLIVRFLFHSCCCLISKVSLSIKNPLNIETVYEFKMSLTYSRWFLYYFMLLMKSTEKPE